MDFKNELLSTLNKLQSNIIGIAKIHGNIEMVVSEDNYSFKTFSIGTMGGLSETNYPKSQFQFENFPIQYESLLDFLNEPILFHNWFDKYFN